MTTDQQKKKAEEAEKINIIESQIEISIEEHLRTLLTAKQKAGLKRMTKSELQQLAKELKGVSQSFRKSQDAINAAIYASDAERQKAEDAKFNAIFGPARMDMDLW